MTRAVDQRGSVVIGLTIVLIVGLLAVGLVARATGTLTSVRRTQDFSAALASADGGLADFLFWLDQGPTDLTHSGSGNLGPDGTFDYQATRVSQNIWRVRVTGMVNDVGHAIEATITRPAKYPYALFTHQDIALNGTGQASDGFGNPHDVDIYSYDSATGLPAPGYAVIGSNRKITVVTGSGGDAQHYYTPNGSCSGCGNPVQKDGPFVADDPVEPASGQPCPLLGQFGDGLLEPYTIDGKNGLPFICNQDVLFKPGIINIVNPPAIIYVGPTNLADVPTTVEIAGATINPGGAGQDFRILKAGTGPFVVGAGAAAGHMTGILYAPSTNVTVNGGDMFIDGSLTLNKLTINGNPNFSLGFDVGILDITSGEWSVTDWQEVPSGTL